MSSSEKANLLSQIFKELHTLSLDELKDIDERLKGPIDLLSEEDLTKSVVETWEDRKRSLKRNPAQFISEHYSDRFWRGFTRAHLKKCDRGLYEALYYWERSNDFPDDVYLPTKPEWNDILTNAQRVGRPVLNLGKRRAARLLAASYRRM